LDLHGLMREHDQLAFGIAPHDRFCDLRFFCADAARLKVRQTHEIEARAGITDRKATVDQHADA
jgi:hypothetical protein